MIPRSRRRPLKFLACLSFVNLISTGVVVNGFTFSSPVTPPLMGIGSVLFRPQGMQVTPSSLSPDEELVTAGKFFTDAFWTGKVGGGAKVLTEFQRRSLEKQQIAEFRRRYGMYSGGLSEMLLCKNGKGELMGCLGIEVDVIQRSDGGNRVSGAPLMSNVAVGRKFRRRGIAEQLVRDAENLVRKEWGYDECYLYVEKRNRAAVKLYQKLGYKRAWEDGSAKTLVPTEGGKIVSQPTVILCMKKRLGGGIFDLFSR